VNKKLDSLEKRIEPIIKFLKGDNELTKALSTITDAVKEVSTSIDVLNKRIELLENQPAERKLAEVGKGLGGGSAASNPEMSLEKALEKAEKEYAHSPNLFAIKQRIRAEYREKFGIEQ
jgi:hypothetical protein